VFGNCTESGSARFDPIAHLDVRTELGDGMVGWLWPFALTCDESADFAHLDLNAVSESARRVGKYLRSINRDSDRKIPPTSETH
jgi:hypothetical protein